MAEVRPRNLGEWSVILASFLQVTVTAIRKVISSYLESRSPASVEFALASGAFYLQDSFLYLRVLDGWLLLADLFDPVYAIPNIAKRLLDDVKKIFVYSR